MSDAARPSAPLRGASPAAFQSAFGAMLAGRGEAPADAALARALIVHRNTASKAAQDALAANYPVARALVGEEAFAAVAAAFVEAAPPASPRLCVYGEGFDAFLATYPPFAELAYLPPVAALERLVVEALFSADAPTLDAGAFAAGVDPDARLALHPAARALRAEAPLATIWLAHQPDGDPAALNDLAWAEETALVTRPAGEVRVTPLDPAAAAFLAVVAEGAGAATLGEAAGAAAEAGDLAQAFATLLGAGALVEA